MTTNHKYDDASSNWKYDDASSNQKDDDDTSNLKASSKQKYDDESSKQKYDDASSPKNQWTAPASSKQKYKGKSSKQKHKGKSSKKKHKGKSSKQKYKGKSSNQKYDDGSNMKTNNTWVYHGVAPWLDHTHDVLLLAMMQLGLFGYLAFGGVCKSWRSFALSNRDKFMSSKAPMSICISTNANEKECRLNDFEGRKFRTTIPHSSGRTCVGLTCGYLILFGEKTKDFWLVNLITNHELHFLGVPFEDHYVLTSFRSFRAILVFSPSVSEWVFVILPMFSYRVWYSIVGTQEWKYVSTSLYIRDLHAFKGKISALHFGDRLSEVRLHPTPKITLLKINNFSNLYFDHPVLFSLGENLYVVDRSSEHQVRIQEINLSKMECVSRENIGEEYPFFISDLMYGAAVIQAQSWDGLRSQYRRCDFTNTSGKRKFFYAEMWYYIHDCLNVNLLNE